MLTIKKLASVAVLTAAVATMSFGHLPSLNDASLIMGRTGGPSAKGKTSRVVYTYSNRGEWSADSIYRGDYANHRGDTISYGTFNGKKLWWWAKFYAEKVDVPGEFAPQGGTSPWVLLNSLSAVSSGTVNYKWHGWNGDMENMTGLKAEVPTWKDGAVGAYSFTHDDIGAMPFDKSVKPAYDLSKEPGFEQIKQNWGIFVAEMSDWEEVRNMVLDGHEMFNHSMRHTSAADQWQWFWPGQTIPNHDPAIPQVLRGLTVVGTWGKMMDNAGSADLKYPDENPAGVITLDGDMVSIKCTGYWTRNAPASDPVGDTLKDNGTPIKDKDGNIEVVIEPIITAKSGVEPITIPTGQKQYVKYTKVSTDENVPNEGTIAATGVTWFGLEELGKYGEGEWATPSDLVTADEGVPGFVAKIFCVKAWEGADFKDNIQDASDTINKNLYEKINTAGEYFRKGKRVEYFGYPFDAYSEVTHDSLEQNGFVGARGGAKSGTPLPGDFFHPYRIDFDAFMIVRDDWDPTKSGKEWAYPNNPHMFLGLNEMVDSIISQKGYMIREFHAVADIPDGEWSEGDDPNLWPVNNAEAGKGGWWGGITKNQLRAHYNYVKGKIDSRDLVIYTVGEVTKYRMTANVAGTPSISKSSGSEYKLDVPTTEALKEKYHAEISVIVSFDESMDSMSVTYDNVNADWGASPRRRPRMMDTAGKIWSVSINPFLGAVTINPNAKWEGQGTDETAIVSGVAGNVKSINAAFNGIQNGRVSLKLPAGTYTAELFSANGRLVNSVKVISNNGIVRTGISTDNLSSGMFILNVKANGAQVMPASKILIK